jgi:RNA polymerase sigma factor for flagellar operon FliA
VAQGQAGVSQVTLSRMQLVEADLPPYPGISLDQISLITSDAMADAALSALMACDAIGFDTESKPTFNKGEVSTGPHLVQLATDTQAYLFPVARLQQSGGLKALLESATLLKVGFGLGNDRSALKTRLGIEIRNVLDLGEVLRGPSHRGTVGAKVAVAHFFGQKLQKSKRIGTSNWANPHLAERQLLYAANDAHVALKLYRAWLPTKLPVA